VLQVQVDLDQQKLQAYGLSSQNVVDAIARQNVITPVGTEKVGEFEYIVSLNDAPSRIAELNDLPIRDVDGVPVYIHDVAYVHEGSPPQINMVRVNGSNAVLMTILKTGSASTLDVIAGVKALLPKLRKTLPSSHPRGGRRPIDVRENRGVGHLRRRGRRRADWPMFSSFSAAGVRPSSL
jgi:multidrug efflux pump subunit AcrB